MRPPLKKVDSTLIVSTSVCQFELAAKIDLSGVVDLASVRPP